MMKKCLIAAIAAVVLLAGCAQSNEPASGVAAEATSDVAGEVSDVAAEESASSEQGSGYQQISQEEAMQMMETEDDCLILDVRTPEEFAEGHIPEAVNIPNESIGDDISNTLKDKDQILLVYCRSGNRSKQASSKLAMMGYTNVFEFGGINTWPGEIVTEEADNSEAAKLQIAVNGEVLTATLEDNSSAAALLDLIGEDSLTLELEDYSGFEKVGELPQVLPTNDEELDTDAGDLILYQGKEFVIYYDQNSWSLTKLGHIDNVSKEDLQELLGEGNVTVELSVAGGSE
jgi:rhodanese-related sulfurtransferase